MTPQKETKLEPRKPLCEGCGQPFSAHSKNGDCPEEFQPVVVPCMGINCNGRCDFPRMCPMRNPYD